MGGAGFRKWLQRVAQLTRRQREQLLEVLRPAVDLDRANGTIEQARSTLACPHCGGKRLYRHGYDRGLLRYRCRACKRTFNALSGTPLARLRHRAGDRVRGAGHVQNANAYHSRFRQWLSRFKGVASHYLPN